jgi:hypothetical protein
MQLEETGNKHYRLLEAQRETSQIAGAGVLLKNRLKPGVAFFWDLKDENETAL